MHNAISKGLVHGHVQQTVLCSKQEFACRVPLLCICIHLHPFLKQKTQSFDHYSEFAVGLVEREPSWWGALVAVGVCYGCNCLIYSLGLIPLQC